MLIAQHTLETTALPANIWALWADVSGYKEWDDGIEWSKLNGAFKAGTSGEIKPRGGRAAVFTLAGIEDGRAFSWLVTLPFTRMRFQHTMEPTDMGTRLTHAVELDGALAWVWARVLGPVYRTNLPAAMRKLARLAERPGLAGISEEHGISR